MFGFCETYFVKYFQPNNKLLYDIKKISRTVRNNSFNIGEKSKSHSEFEEITQTQDS